MDWNARLSARDLEGPRAPFREVNAKTFERTVKEPWNGPEESRRKDLQRRVQEHLHSQENAFVDGRVDRMKRQQAALQQELLDMTFLYESLKNANDQIQKENFEVSAALSQSNQVFEKRCAKLEQETTLRDAELARTQGDLGAASVENQRLLKDKKQLAKSLREAEQALSLLLQQVAGIQKEMTKDKAKLARVTETSKTALDEKDRIMQNMRQEISDAKNDANKSMSALMEKSLLIETLKEELRDTRDKLTKSEAHTASVVANIKGKESESLLKERDLLSDLSQERERAVKWKKQHEAASRANKDLSERIELEAKRVAELLETRASTLEELEKESYSLEEERRQREVAEHKVARLEELMEEERSFSAKEKERSTTLAAEAEQLESHVDTLTAQVEGLHRQLEMERKNSFATLSSQKETNMHEIGKKDTQIHELRTMVSTKQSEVQAMATEMRSQKEMLSVLRASEANANEAMSEVSSLRAELKHARASATSRGAEVAELRRKEDEAEARAEQLQEALKAAQDRLSSQGKLINASEARISDLENVLNEQEKEILNLRQKGEASLVRSRQDSLVMAQAEEDLARDRNSFYQQVQELRIEIEDVKATADHARRREQEAVDEADVIQEKLEVSQRALSEALSRVELAEEQLSQVHRDHEGARRAMEEHTRAVEAELAALKSQTTLMRQLER